MTDEQHLQVGAAIHRRLWRRTRPQFAWAVDARFTDDDLSLLRAELNKIAIADRRTVDFGRHPPCVQAEIEQGGLQGRRYLSGPRRAPSELGKNWTQSKQTTNKTCHP